MERLQFHSEATARFNGLARARGVGVGAFSCLPNVRNDWMRDVKRKSVVLEVPRVIKRKGSH